jgi:hypothetical protein
MNTTGDHTDSTDSTRPDTAAGRAERGTAGWEDAVRLQRWATPDHADFYAVAGEMVATLHALDDLARILRGQVGGYAAAQQGAGRVVYDDTRAVDPIGRLQVAVIQLEETASAVVTAADWANHFWSAIGHIGVERTERASDTEGCGDTGVGS